MPSAPPPSAARLEPEAAAGLRARISNRTGEFQAVAGPSLAPAWLARTPGPASVPPPAAADVAPPPLLREMMRSPALPFTSVAAASDVAAASLPPPRSSEPSSPGFEPRPPMVSLAGVDERALSTATYGGVLEASNAAAGPVAPRAEAAPAARAQAPRLLVELIWAAPDLVARLRDEPSWAASLPEGEPADGDAAQAKADRTTVTGLLVRGSATGDVEKALLATASDEAVSARTFLFEGTLELPFDEAETLRVILAAATILGSADRRFQDTLENAAAVLKTPFGALPEVASSFLARIREAWAKTNRTLPADYLDVQSRRVLLEGRRFRLRELYGETWIRAVFMPPNGRAVPAYLPAATSKLLPLFEAFPARLLAEPVPQADQHETSSVALRVSALGRTFVVGARSAPRPVPSPK